MTITPQDLAGLPCYENAQRLARIETMLGEHCKIEPCTVCKNSTRLTRLEERFGIFWKSTGLIAAGLFAGLIKIGFRP